MTALKNISNIFKTAKEINFDNSSKIIIMSDCHRGDGGGSDNFSANRNLYFHALNHYYKNNYMYIDLGDSEDLWENKDFSKIINTYLEIFMILKKFYNESRLYFVYGNHDIVKKDDKWLQSNYYSYYDINSKKTVSLFPNLKTHKGIVLNYTTTNDKILLLHGHQADFFNNTLWTLSCALVRYIWRPLEILGVHDPSHIANNHKKIYRVEKKLLKWVETQKHILITGHTHRTAFPEISTSPYFNVGCGIYPNSITGIEITNGEIMLIKWHLQTKSDGTLYVNKTMLHKAIKLSYFFDALRI